LSGNSFKGFLNNTIDNLMFGVMDNNMGFHKERSSLRPQMTHPEIKTDGSMFDFIFTAINSLFNRSIFVVLSGVSSTISNFVSNFFSNNSMASNFFNSYTNTNVIFNNVSVFIQLVINLISNLFNTILFTVTNFNPSILITNLFQHMLFIFSFNSVISFYDFNLAFFEKGLQYINNL